MAAQLFRVQLSRPAARRLYLTLSFINGGLTATTAAFIALWARMGELGPGLRTFTRYVLVQGHLATENVIAAWYSSMLMLLTAAAAAFAFAADRRRGAGALRFGWLLFAAVFMLLSLDEIGSFHERVGMLTGTAISQRAVGWVYLLGLPIVAVGLFMLTFGWMHVRRVPAAFWLLAAGVGMFLLNPVLEVFEMALIHGAGATPGTWQRHVHDVLLVLEEGGLELFGILCFLAAALTYVSATSGAASEWRLDEQRALWLTRGSVVVLLAGIWATGWLVTRLPPGDTGIPQHWFPAAALLALALGGIFLVGGGVDAVARRRLAIVAIALSAFFGAGLHGYTTWRTYDTLRLALNGSLAVLFAVAVRENCSRTAAGVAIAAALLMAAAVTVPGPHVPFTATAAAGLAAEALLRRGRTVASPSEEAAAAVPAAAPPGTYPSV
ncbi:MAG TPA: hypothetical protein VM364_22490 [Vicinamibacterales bacterium]|nr:hypothetical protein [Vicinamibacterales bacterium]